MTALPMPVKPGRWVNLGWVSSFQGTGSQEQGADLDCELFSYLLAKRLATLILLGLQHDGLMFVVRAAADKWFRNWKMAPQPPA